MPSRRAGPSPASVPCARRPLARRSKHPKQRAVTLSQCILTPSRAEPSLCCQPCALSLVLEQVSNPHRARCAVSDPYPAISCLGASRTPPVERVVKVIVTASEKPTPTQKIYAIAKKPVTTNNSAAQVSGIGLTLAASWSRMKSYAKFPFIRWRNRNSLLA
jgi:hypothetical protein